MKAKAIQLNFVNGEFILIPVSEISHLFMDKVFLSEIFENKNLKSQFESKTVQRTAESIVLKVEKNKIYTSGGSKSEKHKLTDFLERNDITGLRCYYGQGKLSYEIKPKWSGGDKNELQKCVNDEGIMLFLGDSARI